MSILSSGRRLVWDFSSLAVGQLLSMLLGFAGFAYLARTLSAESYGLVEYAVGLSALASIVIEGGLGPVGALGIARDRTRAPELAGSIFVARVLLTVLLIPLVGLSTMVTGQGVAVAALVWLYALSLFAVPFKQDWLLQGLERMTLVAPVQALRSAVFAFGVFLIVRHSSDLVVVGAIEIAAAAATAIYYLAAQRAVGVRMKVEAQMLQALPLIRAGAAVGASNIIWTFMLYAPIFLVTNLSGPAEAAWLGGAQRIVYSLVGFSALYFFNLYPAIVRSFHESRDGWERLMGSSYRLVAWGSLGIALVATVVAERVVVLAYGQAFSIAASVFSIYIWLLPVRLVSGHARWALVAGERQELLLASECLATVALLALGAWLIPAYGAVGAAASVVAANVVGWLSAHLLTEKHVGRLPSIRETLLPVGAALGCVALAEVLGHNEIISILAAVTAYLVCLYLASGNLIDDLRRLSDTKRTVAG
jgi:O-antigen/teichoic acid export membrane protein